MINEEIHDREVRLIDENGEQLGVMLLRQALDLAENKELDLVKISPNAKPPVCKIMDYGKYRFEQSKREREAKKNQKIVNIKEVRLSPGIEEYHMGFKAKDAARYLKDGDKVKVSIRFRGRQITHAELGDKAMKTFYSMVQEVANMERSPKLEGRSMIMILTPKT